MTRDEVSAVEAQFAGRQPPGDLQDCSHSVLFTQREAEALKNRVTLFKAGQTYKNKQINVSVMRHMGIWVGCHNH